LKTVVPNLAGFSFLVRNYAAQDERFRPVFNLISGAIANHAFPACSLAVARRGELIAHKAFGHFTYDPASPAVSTDSIFDLASVTKVVATTTMAMILYERGLVDLDAPLTAIIPEFAGDDERRQQVAIGRSLPEPVSVLGADLRDQLAGKRPDAGVGG